MTMLPTTEIDRTHVLSIDVVVTTRASRMNGGLVGSVGLHVLLLLALLLWPFLTPPPVAEPQLMPVNLVRFAAKTTAPAAAMPAPVPQQQAREETQIDHSRDVPTPQLPPPPTAPVTAPQPATPAVPPIRKPVVDADVAIATKAAKIYKPPAVKQQQPPAPSDDLSKKLHELSLLRQPSPPIPADPQRQNGAGLSNTTTGSADAAQGTTATYSVRDFIRAQVERRWNLDGSMVKADDWRISIHITLRRDGSVMRAEIVDDTRLHTNRAFRDFAYSARDAVILSSPLAIPAGAYDIARDIVIDFDPRRVLQ
jgi:outer membrane biosynthesis protein TonB